MAKSKKTVSKRQAVAPADYAKFVTELKKKIRSAQFKAALAVNRELIRCDAVWFFYFSPM
jgi:hypothetical protein